ncbi:McrC family protein [Providencia rettgeri]|uniref:McrC family protein n=1 Tax=Providencia sp. MGF014 TaxID=2565573 RepID=UPI00109D246B|nr:McrC family protein [Providencia rettgeri]ELR5176772.1 McrC family protein [Providencia rettgeri]THB25565.1 restriction endonuclease [Providencia sp. MGF014]
MPKEKVITLFEYGYLVSEEDKERARYAKPLTDSAFRWLEQCCLKDKDAVDQRLLTLCTRSGVKVLQVKNYVGILALPKGIFIEILPKIGKGDNDTSQSRDKLLMMLRTLKTFRCIASSDASLSISKMTLPDIFVYQFIRSLQILLRKGIKSDYIRQSKNNAWLKGKLRVSEQIKLNSVRRDRFFVEYDEYRVERIENRILKTAVEKVYNEVHNPQLRIELRKLCELFESVPMIRDLETAFRNVVPDRHMQHYVLPLEWAKLILSGNSPHCMSGNADAVSMLFPAEAVFEAFISQWMRHHMSDDWTIKCQSRQHSLTHYNDKKFFQLKPDILLLPKSHKQNSLQIYDAKWKIINSEDEGIKNAGLSQSDFYQMYAYGMKYLNGKGDIFLIYPAHEGFKKPYQSPFKFNSNLRLWVVPFDLNSSIRDSGKILKQHFEDICHDLI